MSTELHKPANMPKLVLLYVATLIMGICIGFGLMQIWWKYSGEGFPLLILMYIVPMMAAMTAAKTFVKDTGRKATFGYSLIFGLITAALVLALVYLALEMGWLDMILYQVDRYAMENGERMKVYLPMLIITGGLALFVNVMMFWAATVGEIKRRDKLAAKAAAKAGQ